jgi:O-6-methylguanine DNA methyltransferase
MTDKAVLCIGQTGNTPLGKFWLACTDLGLAALEWGKTQAEFEAWLSKRFKRTVVYDPQKVSDAAKELSEYLSGKRRLFTLVIDWTLFRPFQRIVLQATCSIPYGETRTYKDIAAQINRANAARAVGRAEATNPIPLVIPCHRVIGSDGKLHGYGLGEGLKTKEWLLKLEGALIA